MYLANQAQLIKVKKLAQKAYTDKPTKAHKALRDAVRKLDRGLKKEEDDRDACRGLGSD